MASYELDKMLKTLTIKDLRQELRARGCSPAGSQETLLERLREHIDATGETQMKVANVVIDGSVEAGPGNNYSRPEGQNVGNFLTERPTSRVLAAPGGNSTLVLGDDGGNPSFHPETFKAVASPFGTTADEHRPSKREELMQKEHEGMDSIGVKNNNYSRPGGQNQGNFITDRPSSRVLAPPGGASSITF